ncbi:GspE/PulE family protein [Pseudoduganella buxea]|uniref:Type II secretion system ATPase PulE n=1 Tax=Pseudoduganella buxea TaxID=1949069 RepID=A0A6I3T4F4_9BURK|nr:GspE/PulE family protein [Pseudoduganella buxea]MTV56458.1 type II/IV secretion system protein [Pseudoduganella buxea]GGB92611.1 type II secretion system ATPase PulE [Pseudoduganella buxea]
MNAPPPQEACLSGAALLALLARRGTGESVFRALEEELGLAPAAALAELGRVLRMPTLDIDALHALTPDFALLAYGDAVRGRCLVARAGAAPALLCVTVDPFDTGLQTLVEARLPQPPRWHLAHPDDLAAYFTIAGEKLRALDASFEAQAPREAAPGGAADLSLESISQDASPVVKLVNSSIFDALKAGVSDMHFEVGAKGLTLKYRIDGVLSHVLFVPGGDMSDQVVSRLKVMSDLDISERRVPQDGRFKLHVKGRQIDFRVSIMPSLFGEDVVVRILDKEALADQIVGLRLDHLGFDAGTLRRVRQLAREPYGMTLVTGPTGSGKTTTLYAALTEINSGQDKIVTIEDPVEYQLPGILQIPVNEKKGLTFALGLRSILRHDPDKILVGEIRDPETARIAIQSALTGHQVFTSVHANNVFDVLGRFLHMGVDIYSFVSALNGILAQRLMRIACEHCAVPYLPDADELVAAGIDPALTAGGRFVRARGCGQCRGTGFKGRKAIGEFLRMNDQLRELIIGRAPIRQIKEAAQQNGTRFLRDAAIDAARNGITTIEEVNRVTFAE